jgi:hypothetical protein
MCPVSAMALTNRSQPFGTATNLRQRPIVLDRSADLTDRRRLGGI